MVTRIVNVVLGLSLVAAVGAIGVSSGAQTPSQADSRAAAQAAFREGGLRAAAAVSGEYAVTTEWISEVSHTLESLVKLSDVVLVGELGENRAHLSASGEYISTDYRMRVERSLKGDVRPQSDVVFGVMGSKVVFEDGSSAVIATRGFVRPNTGARVVIFAKPFPVSDRLMTPALRAYASDAPVFWLVGMGQGVIEVPRNERIRPGSCGN